MAATRNPAGEPKPASVLVEDMLGVLRRQFYADRPEERWHWERELLVKAITHPAWVLEKRGGDLPADKYQEILQGIIRTIQHHGSTQQVRNFGRYFLAAVQSHMRIHWSEYYQQAKSIRSAVAKALPTRSPSLATASPVSALAEVHRTLLATKAGRPKGERVKGQAPKQQGELF